MQRITIPSPVGDLRGLALPGGLDVFCVGMAGMLFVRTRAPHAEELLVAGQQPHNPVLSNGRVSGISMADLVSMLADGRDGALVFSDLELPSPSLMARVRLTAQCPDVAPTARFEAELVLTRVPRALLLV